jgi:diguanylate cyclase (GGDEF)-like protein/PAS domain S-box-containing protein
MNDQAKANAELIEEISCLNQRIGELEFSKSERKRMEEALRESEKMLSSIIQGFSIPAFVIGKDHKVLYWNQALERLSKIPAAEVVGTNQHWRAFYTQERPCMADLLVDEVIDKIPHWYEGKYIKSRLIDDAYEATDFFPALGEKGDWLRFTAAAVRDFHGNLIGAVETLEDITERKRAEEELKESEERFHKLADSTWEGIIIHREGIILDVNESILKMFGWHAEEVIGKSVLEFLAPESIEPALQKLGESIDTPQIYLEAMGLKKDKTVFPIEVLGRPIRYKNLHARVMAIRDITERKQSEESLRINNQRFFEVLNNLDALVYVTDIQTNELLFINKYGRDIWGDIEGKICWQTIQAGQTGPCEFCTNDRLVGPDGKPTEGIVWEFQNTVNGRWYECRDRAIHWPDGRIVRMEIATDITVRKQDEEDLDRYRKQIKLILESVGDGIYGVDPSGRTAFANPSTFRITGYEVGDLIGRDQHAALHHTKADGSPYPVEECQIHKTLRDGKIRHVSDEVFWKKDGTSFYVEYVVTPMIENNRLTGAVIIFKDITERKRAENELRLSEERYRTILRDIEDGYHEVDLAGSFTFFNESFRKIMGYSHEELLGMNYKQYAADRENAKKVRGLYNGIYGTGEPVQRFDWDIIRKDGERRTVEVSVSLIRNAEGRPEGFRGIVRDITERKKQEEEIRKLSITDQLTGLYNRRGFIALAEQQMKTSNRAKRQMMFAFIDIDCMKWINDTLGHKEGDRAILDTANILRQTFRESDIIARMGGDEFAVLAIDVADMNPDILSDRLEQLIATHNTKVNRPFRLSMSRGVAVYDPASPVSLDELMSQSDRLMYIHKKAKANK